MVVDRDDRKIGRFANVALSAFALSLMLSACSKTTPAPNETLADTTTGTISGIVRLVDANGFSPRSPYGVSVQVDAIEPATTTDSSGSYTIRGLARGVHSVSFFKTGYGGVVVYNLTIAGEGTYYLSTQHLAERSTMTVSIDSFSIRPPTGKQSAQIELHLHNSNPKAAGNAIALVVSPDSNNIFEHTPHYTSVEAVGASNTLSTTIEVSGASLAQMGFASGTRLYAVATGIAQYDYISSPVSFASYYYDPLQQSQVYSARGPSSNLITFVLP